MPMELTKEYFDQTIAKMASKEDLKSFATKDDLKNLGKQLEDYTQEVAQGIIEATDFGFNKIERRLDKVEILLKPMRSDVYQVKDTPKAEEEDIASGVRRVFLEAMDRKGIKWYNR
jgi:hypothetical protein